MNWDSSPNVSPSTSPEAEAHAESRAERRVDRSRRADDAINEIAKVVEPPTGPHNNKLNSVPVSIPVGQARIAGTVLTPGSKVPGVLFVHGWGGSRQTDLERARAIAGLGCVCLSFDLRGHGETLEQQATVTRDDNLRDVVAAFDTLAKHPAIDEHAICVIGCSYGAYLSALLAEQRPIRWLAMQAPALYRDQRWQAPKLNIDRADLVKYRMSSVTPEQNRALAACATFRGDVLLVESEHDDFVPHTTLMNYRSAFRLAHSMTHRRIDGADHGLSSEASQRAYRSVLVSWVTEMIVGARVGGAH